MAETTSTLLQILLMATGGRTNDWGVQTNNNLTKLEEAIAGSVTLNETGTTTVLTDDQARKAIILTTGTLIANHIIQVPNRTKSWTVRNGHTLGAFALQMKTASGAAITIPAGLHLVTCNGADVMLRSGSEAVANGDLATMAANTVKANLTGGAATPTDVTLSALADALRGLVNYTGEIKEWGGTIATIPSGWLFCDGSAVSRTTYAALFAAIGTRHGAGDGSTTFNLPDKRDKFNIGASQDDSGVPKTNVTGSLTTSGGSKDAIVVEHTHTATVTDPGHNHTFGTLEGASAAPGNHTWTTGTNRSTSTGTTGITVANSTEGSSGTNANLPPYTAAVFMIKT